MMKSKKHTVSPPKKTIGKKTPSLTKYRPEKKQPSGKGSRKSVLNEPSPSYSVTSRIRPIGNSKGVILPNRVIEEAGLSVDADLLIQVSGGVIVITKANLQGTVNTDLSSWDEQFRNAIKNGNKPEKVLWDRLQNRFDEEEWS
jgi:antitoxin component of MazEF toxin-antitoxin module